MSSEIYDSYNVSEEGDINCNHQWEDYPTLDCLPPIYSHRCLKCGRAESWSYRKDVVTIPFSSNQE